MKKIILLLFCGFITLSIKAQPFPITADILRQTYQIQTDTLSGTCFLIEVNNQEYILTAKHLFKANLRKGDSTTITIVIEDKLKKLNVSYFIHNDNAIDIAVLKLKNSIKVMPPFSIGGSVVLGQDIYFLGYPSFNNLRFGTSGIIGILPIVKKGIVSGWIWTGACNLYFLDGHNNPGFSGGPVVCIDYNTKKPVLFGVISGYYYENKPVRNKQGQNDSTYIQENSGIIKCFPAEIVNQIVETIK